jgi:2-polyprenyl-3-methyl-5-hydroxy-6-metoxy-1,4-benzoquinol methylase
MSSRGTLLEEEFEMDNYEDFYVDHHFQSLPDDVAISAHRIMPRVAWAVDVAKETQPKSVLDLGCLEGFAVLTLANHIPSVTYGVGVDLSKDGIDLANTRTGMIDTEVEFIQDSIEHYLETTEDRFDLITLFEVIEHVKDPAKLLELIDRVKTDDATILISTPDFEAPTYGKDDEKNKCHIRLYTLADDDYEAVNKYGNTRKATSMSKQVGKERIIEMGTYSELINCRYK